MAKLDDNQKKLDVYERKLKQELKGYRGVVHESASSELKHSKIMVLQDMVRSLRQELEKLELSKPRD